jgi:hypothetical protein
MTQNETTVGEALKELAKEEEALIKADNDLGRAVARYRIAAKRYAAVRDVVEEMLDGVSPYAEKAPIRNWPSAPSDDTVPWFESHNFGRYRYLFKSVGDAVYEALCDAEESRTLAQLVDNLKKGGLVNADARTVNASLLNMKGVEKTADGKYQVATDDVDNLPF